VQLDLYTHIILSVLSVYQSANKGICNNDTRWKFKIKLVICSRVSFSYTPKLNHIVPIDDGQIVDWPRWFMSTVFSEVSDSTTGRLWGLFAIYSHRNKF
jgi:hypothetical protein